MPAVARLDALLAAAAEFPVGGLDLAADPAAVAAARLSLDTCGLLLLGEVHGVRENPQLISALMRALDVTGLAMEWPEEMTPVIGDFLESGTLADHPMLWFGDGRLTAGHLALLAGLAAAGSPEPVFFDGVSEPGWSERDEAMARRLLACCPPGGRTLVVAGNLHTPTTPIEFGVPLGAHLARQRPGVREVRVRYAGGTFYNCGSVPMGGSVPVGGSVPMGGGLPGPARLSLTEGELVLSLPHATEAVVPHRPSAAGPSAPDRGAAGPGAGDRSAAGRLETDGQAESE